MKTSLIRFFSALVAASLLVNNASPVLAGFSIFGIEVPDPGQLGKKKAEELALQKVSEVLGKEAPVYYNVKNAYQKVEAPKSFNPQYVSVNSVADMNRKLPPGDYWINIVTYCSHITIAHSGSNMAHAIAPAEGKMVTLLANLTLRGEIAHTSHAKLQKLKWIIQTGLPLSQWLPEDRTVVHQLIPDFEQDLKGDTIDEMQGNYAAFQKQFPILPGFEDVLGRIPFGKQVIAMRNARKVLTEQGIADRQIGGRLFEVTDPGDATPPPVIAPEDSPWYQINDHVIARAVITHAVPVIGYSTTQDLQDDSQLGINRFEFRILGNSQSKEIKPIEKAVVGGIVLGESVAEILYGAEVGAIAGGSVGGPFGVGVGATAGIIVVGAGLILYSINHPTQPLTTTVAFGGNGGGKEDCPEKGKISDEVPQNQKEDLLLQTAESGSAPIKSIMDDLGDAKRLVAHYGGSLEDWVKVTTTQVVVDNGVASSIHFFMNKVTGRRVEFKFKREINKDASRVWCTKK